MGTVCDLLTDEQRYLFDLWGYLTIPNALDDTTLSELNDLVDAQGLPTPGEVFADQLFSGFLTWGQQFRDLLDHPAVLPVLTELLDGRPRLDRYYGLRMRSMTTGLPLHGGAVETDDKSEYYWFRNGKMANGIITVGWALTDMRAGQGGFVCVPGSHKSNYAWPKGWDHQHEAVRHVELSAGDVVVFNGALVHGTHPWLAEHDRRSLLFKYAPGHLAWSHVYLDWSDQLRDVLTPAQLALLAPPHCPPPQPDATAGFVR